MNKVIETQSDQKLTLIEPNYDGMAKMFNALSKLYLNANDKKVIDDLVNSLSTPAFLFNNNQNQQ